MTRPRRGRPFYKRWKARGLRRLNKVETPKLVWLGAALVATLVLLLVVDIPALLADTRDWLLRTFGMGLAIAGAWAAALAIALGRGAYADRPGFARRTIGAGALGLFAWGALGLNRADWSLWGTAFQEVTVGGDIGHALVDGFLARLAWLALGVLAMSTLAPAFSLALARNIPKAAAYTWAQGWIQSFFRAAWRVTSGVFAPATDAPPRPAHAFETTYIGEDDEEINAVPSPPPLAAVVVEDHPGVLAPYDDVVDTPAEPEQLGFDLSPRKSKWQYPALDLLQAPMPATHRKHDNAARAQLIVDTLSSFGVDATIAEVNEGPTVTQFGVEPGWEVKTRELLLKDSNGKTVTGPDGRQRTEKVEVSRTRVRVNRITALQNDLALALAAPSLRIEAPVPGRAIVGIEVPNDSATVVTLRSVMETREFADSARKSKLTIALGRGVSGVPQVADLAKMPHLLIAGATGSGKSVCINSIIAGIMMNASPDEVRFVMVDPKRVELSVYGEIPHLAFSEVIVDVDKVVGVLQAVVSEMESRYKKFAEVAVRNLEAYNKHPRILKKLPQWVVIIDELADLMMAAPFEVEKLICRLAQLARATGIHLVVATQRPSVDVVTGLIKANFPTRVAFAVTSQVDSRTILDMGGAEKLLGRGDMLYLPRDAAKPIRIQGVYLSDAEVERLVAFWTDVRFAELAPEKSDALIEEALIAQNGGDADLEVEDDDPVLEQARALAKQHSRVSPSLMQRRLQVGYVKACRIIDQLQDEGLVGPREDGESRRVLQPAFADDF
jgi:S-DNA-T family DNA segregation ATPase FtsK/SpoIIIE